MHKDLSLPRLLIVDDAPEYLRALELVLRSSFELRGVGSFHDAQAVLTVFKPDAALVDVCLDEMVEHDRSGLDLVIWLKTRLQGLPVVVMSALDDDSLPNEVEKTGADAFLKKPVNLSELRRLLDLLITELDR